VTYELQLAAKQENNFTGTSIKIKR